MIILIITWFGTGLLSAIYYIYSEHYLAKEDLKVSDVGKLSIATLFGYIFFIAAIAAFFSDHSDAVVYKFKKE